MYIRCLNIYQLNVVKKIKKDYKKKVEENIKAFINKKRKKPTIWSWTLQKSLTNWKKKNLLSTEKNIIECSFWNIISFLNMWLESSIFWNRRNFLRVGSFNFLSAENYFLKYNKFFRVSVSLNINFFGGFFFLKYKDSFLLSKCKKFLFLKHNKSSWCGFFFIFQAWAEKCKVPFPEI